MFLELELNEWTAFIWSLSTCPLIFQYAEAVRNIAQAYLELINTQDKDGFIEQVQVCFQTYGSPQR